MSSSVGTALFLSLQARTEALEKDMAKGKAIVRDFTKGVSKDAESAAGSLSKIGLSAGDAKNAFKNLAGGILLSAGQMEGADKTATALTQTFGAFLTGGKIAAGIVGLTALFRALAGEEDAAAKAHRTWLDGLSASIKATEKDLDGMLLKLQSINLRMSGIDVSPDQLGLRKELDANQARIDELLRNGDSRETGELPGELAKLLGRNRQIDRILEVQPKIKAGEEAIAKIEAGRLVLLR